MWVDAVLLLAIVALLALLIEGAYTLGKRAGYDEGRLLHVDTLDEYPTIGPKR